MSAPKPEDMARAAFAGHPVAHPVCEHVSGIYMREIVIAARAAGIEAERARVRSALETRIGNMAAQDRDHDDAIDAIRDVINAHL